MAWRRAHGARDVEAGPTADAAWVRKINKTTLELKTCRSGGGRKGRRGRGRAGMGGGKGEEEEPDVKVAKVEEEDEQGDVSDVPMAEEAEEEKLAEAEAETEDAEDLKYAQELELGVEERGESEEPGIGKECSDDEHAAHQSLKRIKKIKKRVGAANCDKLKQTELLCLEQHPCDREDRQ